MYTWLGLKGLHVSFHRSPISGYNMGLILHVVSLTHTITHAHSIRISVDVGMYKHIGGEAIYNHKPQASFSMYYIIKLL